MSPRISVIIPTLNEAKSIASTLASVSGTPGVEVIVVDGKSQDGTVEVAKSCGAEVMTTCPGRAGQMNRGAARARGEFLLFLHGDTRLPMGFESHVYHALAEPRTVAGAFDLRIDAEGLGIRFIERVANVRSRRFGLPYGDQGIFLQAGLFRYLGGFPQMPIMEDFEMMRRLRRKGRIAIVPAPAVTSARRWRGIGLWRATAINYGIPIAYYLGVSPERLARWYRQGPCGKTREFQSAAKGSHGFFSSRR
jgi:rSAM/selenodomain-associated transferase 2